jgi:hypothetical protein
VLDNRFGPSYSQGAGVTVGDDCGVHDAKNDLQAEGYCQLIILQDVAKVFCATDGEMVLSVAYDLALRGNCKEKSHECSSGDY